VSTRLKSFTNGSEELFLIVRRFDMLTLDIITMTTVFTAAQSAPADVGRLHNLHVHGVNSAASISTVTISTS
jgi:hypothetical protein